MKTRLHRSGQSGLALLALGLAATGANNYVVPGSRVVGPLTTTSGTITNLNPWANFSF